MSSVTHAGRSDSFQSLLLIRMEAYDRPVTTSCGSCIGDDEYCCWHTGKIVVASIGSVCCFLLDRVLIVNAMVAKARWAASEISERSASYVGAAVGLASRTKSWGTPSSLRAGNFLCNSFTQVSILRWYG